MNSICRRGVLAATICVIGSTVGFAEQIQLDVSSSYGKLEADKKQTVWVRVGATGFELKSQEDRSPVNLALVLDKSGSMKGEKIAKARQAAIDAIDRLDADDIVTVITYDTTVNVLVPATKLADKTLVKSAISSVQAGGNTALFAGVSKGASEVRKFLDEDHINRIILLSDGHANEGPSSPTELGALGASLRKEGIAVSTMGLGLSYNEDLMTKLAAKSGGNHQFIEHATELADVFNQEFEQVTSVVAQDVQLKIKVADEIRPVRVIGSESEIAGQEIQLSFNQLYSKQNRHVVIELEIPAQPVGKKLKLAKVNGTYRDILSENTEKFSGATSVAFVEDEEAVKKSLNKDVMEDVVALVAGEQNRLATDYLDAGNIGMCAQTLTENSFFLRQNVDLLESKRLEEILMGNTTQLEAIEQQDVNRARKDMRYFQNAIQGNAPSDFSKLASPSSAKPDAVKSLPKP